MLFIQLVLALKAKYCRQRVGKSHGTLCQWWLVCFLLIRCLSSRCIAGLLSAFAKPGPGPARPGPARPCFSLIVVAPARSEKVFDVMQNGMDSLGEDERNAYVSDFKGFVTYVRDKGFRVYADKVRWIKSNAHACVHTVWCRAPGVWVFSCGGVA